MDRTNKSLVIGVLVVLVGGYLLMRWNQGDPSPSELIDATAPVTEVRVETTS